MKTKTYKQYFTSIEGGMNCVITGASSGIGRQLAIELFSSGANIILVARREQVLKEIVMELQSKNQTNTVDYFVADVSELKDTRKLYNFVTSKFSHLDILVANAGASMHASILESTEIIYQQMMKSNYYSVVNLLLPFLPLLKENKQRIGIKARVVAVTSIQSLIGVPDHAAYVAAKHATGGFLETLELEEPDIDITEIIPGWVSGTDIRSHAMDGKGSVLQGRAVHKRHSRSSITLEECIDAILEGIVKNHRLIYRPKFWRNILFIKYCMRGILHRLIIERQKYSSSA